MLWGGRWSLAVWFTSLRVMLIPSWKTSLQMLFSNPHLAYVSSSAHLEGGLGCHVSLIWFLYKKAQSNFLLTILREPCVVQSLNHVWLFVSPWTAAHHASLSLTASQSLPKLMSSESMMLSNHRILCHPLLLLSSVFPNIRVFSSESALCIGCHKYWSFSFSISPSSEYSGLISFRIDWFDLLAVQGTLKSLFQHHNFKTSILQCSTFFYEPTLTSVQDYWKNHSFDYMYLCGENDVLAF